VGYRQSCYDLRLTAEEFHLVYDGRKPYYEFSHGEAIQKPMPTVLHILIQYLLVSMLREAGYKAFFELELRIQTDWHPIPDVVALHQIEQPYPTKAVEVIFEILSPGDQMVDLRKKCERYALSAVPAADATGFVAQGTSRPFAKQIIVIDPEHRAAFEWLDGRLIMVEEIAFPNGRLMELTELWNRLDRELP